MEKQPKTKRKSQTVPKRQRRIIKKSKPEQQVSKGTKTKQMKDFEEQIDALRG